jgi:DNA-binding MarR family transcriptional regulator
MAKAFDLQTSPGHLLRRAQQYANDLYTQEVGPDGLTPRQFAVLHAVDQHEGMSQTALVRETGIDRSTLADMISRMLRKDLLARKRTDEDARANAVRITPAGRKALRAAMPAVTKSEQKILEILPARVRTEFTKGLSLIAQAALASELAKENGDAAKGKRGRKKR